MNRPLVEHAFTDLTHQKKTSFGGKLTEDNLTLGGPQTIGRFLVDVADHLDQRFSRLPETPPTKGRDKSARERLIIASDMLGHEGQALLEIRRSLSTQEQQWLARCMYISAPWVRMTAALLDDAERELQTGASDGSDVDRRKR